MNSFVLWNLRIYRVILLLYPGELRHRFGEEIGEVFASDLACAVGCDGIVGAGAVWRDALTELLSVALPRRLANPAMQARAVSLALHISVAGMLLALAALASDGKTTAVAHGFISLRFH